MDGNRTSLRPRTPAWEALLIVLVVASLVSGILLGVPYESGSDDSERASTVVTRLDDRYSQLGRPAYRTEHYLIYSDAPAEPLADVAERLEVMHAEYARAMRRVLKPFDGRGKVFFIDDAELFVQAGGRPHAPGVFRQAFDQIGPRLLLRNSGEAIYLELTQLIQHEAWHQFCWHHVRAGVPIWLDEGLAHHFSYGIWTGDRVVYGGVHVLIRHLLRQNTPHFMPLADFLQLDDAGWATWQSHVGFWAPYMQGWSLIQFLLYAEQGKHAPLLDAYLADVAAGRDASASREAIVALEKRWQAWLKSLGQTTTHVAYFEAIAATLAGHLARAEINGQTFTSIEEFRAAAKTGTLRLGDVGSATWLPASVMVECERHIDLFSRYYVHLDRGPIVLELERVDDGPAVRLKVGDAEKMNLLGVAKVADGRVTSVEVRGLDGVPVEYRRGAPAP